MSLTNAKQPGHGLWSCCKAKPVKVQLFDNGSAHAVCQSCATSYARYNGPQWIADLPEGWTAPTHEDYAKRLAESALELHRVIGQSDGPEAYGDSEPYRNSRFTLIATIITAYGAELKAAGVDAETVLNLTIDSGEDVAYCARYAIDHPEIHPFRI